MAKKAGLLAVGGDAAANAARRGEAELIITASDASEASVRRAKSNAEANGIKHVATPFTMYELGTTAGRGSPGTIAFLDKGLSEGFLKKLADTNVNADTKDDTNTKAKKTKESDA